MLLKDIIKILEENYPPVLAYEWDNSGLILGDTENEIKKCILSLDVTEDIINQAVENNAQLIISHHPLVFSGIKKINNESSLGKLLLMAAKNNISIYAAHTNMDCSLHGINKKLADLFNLKNCEVIEKNPIISDSGLGCIGEIDAVSLITLLNSVKEKLNISTLRYSGCDNQIIKKLAICSGSGADLIPAAIKFGADAIITGDLKYHTALDYTSEDFAIIDAGHFSTEFIAVEMFYELLKDLDFEIIKAKQNDIFKLI